ncbi:hypothetical protein [Hymenobacter sp. B81]|uniref:hypothetical protein n=1 Tax=Hymenobacter sp. B81 TaxID=3344878 RepID=UPI0037DCB913
MFWLLYNLFALLDGICDALLYGQRGAESFRWNEHTPLTARRTAAVAAALGAAADAVLMPAGGVELGRAMVPYWLLWFLWQGAAAALSFSLFHNEAYNFGRVWIQQQQLARAWQVFRFNYQSPTTSARFDFDGTVRWVMAATAGLVMAAGFILLAQL